MIRSLYIAKTFPTATVYGAEPVPLLHTAAELNTAPYKDRIHLFQGGLGKEAGQVAFDFDPGFSAGASMHKDVIQQDAMRRGLMEIVRASVIDLGLVGFLPKSVANIAAAILAIPVVNWVFLVACAPLIVLFLVFDRPRPRKIHVACDVITIPALLQRLGGSGHARIDFLKVDVEGAEWDVLLGIDDSLWAKIDQIIVEVHNLENDTRLETVKTLLRAKGFANVTQDEEEFELHKIMGMGTVFATRTVKKPAAAADSKRAPSTPRKGKKSE